MSSRHEAEAVSTGTKVYAVDKELAVQMRGEKEQGSYARGLQSPAGWHTDRQDLQSELYEGACLQVPYEGAAVAR